MLEKVQMAPGFFNCIMCFAAADPAGRTIERGAAFKIDPDVQSLLGRIEFGRFHNPGIGDAKGQLKKFDIFHSLDILPPGTAHGNPALPTRNSEEPFFSLYAVLTRLNFLGPTRYAFAFKIKLPHNQTT